jgi:hypothetical protein
MSSGSPLGSGFLYCQSDRVVFTALRIDPGPGHDLPGVFHMLDTPQKQAFLNDFPDAAALLSTFKVRS